MLHQEISATTELATLISPETQSVCHGGQGMQERNQLLWRSRIISWVTSSQRRKQQHWSIHFWSEPCSSFQSFYPTQVTRKHVGRKGTQEGCWNSSRIVLSFAWLMIMAWCHSIKKSSIALHTIAREKHVLELEVPIGAQWTCRQIFPPFSTLID